MTKAALLVGLTGLALSSTAGARPVDDDKPPGYEPALDDVKEFCKQEFSTPEDAEARWEDTGTFLSLDMWIDHMHDGKQHNWLRDYRAHVFDGDQEGPIGGCSTLNVESSCEPGMEGWNCKKYFENAKVEGSDYNDHTKQNAYWIFEAVKGARRKLGWLHAELVESAIMNGFKVDEMVDDLSGEDDTDENVLDWMKAAFTAVGAVPGAGPVAAIVSSGLSLAETEKDPINGAVSSAISDSLKATKESLSTILDAAMGESEDPEDYEKLPALRDDSLRTDVAKFFNGGWWIVDESNESIREAVKEAGENFGKKVANSVIAKSEFKLIADRRDDRADDCEDKTSGVKMDFDGESLCVYLAKTWTATGVNGKPGFDRAGGDYYEKMSKYGIDDKKFFFDKVLDCAANGGDGQELDVGDMTQGETPRCFFKMEAHYMDDNPDCKAPGRPSSIGGPSCSDWKLTKIENKD